MVRKNRFTAAIAVLMASVMMLAGCGGSNGMDSQESQGSSSSVPQTQTGGNGGETDMQASAQQGESQEEASADENDPFGKYEEPITITFACSTSGMEMDPNREGFKSMEDNLWMDAYRDMGINIEHIWTTSNEDLLTKWNVAIAGNDLPDVAVVPATVYGMLLEGDKIEDMTDWFDLYASDQYKEALEMEGGIGATYITQNGRWMGLPCTGATPKGGQQLCIRKDWLDKLGLPVPTTVDELLDTMRAFVDAKLGGEGTIGMVGHMDLDNTGQCDLLGFFNGFGAHLNVWKEVDGKLVYGSVVPEVKEALQVLQDMYKEGLLPQDFAVKSNSEVGELVAAGKCGISYGSYWAPSGMVGSNMQNDPEAEWIVVDGVTKDGSRFETASGASPGSYIFVRKGVEHPEAIVKLMNLQLKLRTAGDDKWTADEYVQGQFFSIAPGLNISWANETNAELILEALETGDESKVLGTSVEANYYRCLARKVAAEEASIDAGWNVLLEHGIVEDGLSDEEKFKQWRYQESLAIMWDTSIPKGKEMFDNGQVYLDRWGGRYSSFAQTNFSNITTELHAAYLRIIMGEDIDTFETAVDTWYKMGGEPITKEVNEWYESTK